MNIPKIIAQPLFAATIGLTLAASWAWAYTDATRSAGLAASKVRPWTVLARSQMADVGACEARPRAAALATYPGAQHATDREILARQGAFECASAYLLAQPLISPSVASQVLGYAAGAAVRKAALGDPATPPPSFSALYQRSAADARMATLDAQKADLELAAACQGLLSSSACSVAALTPDRPERRLGDSMRDFEIDVHAQAQIAAQPAEEASYQSKAGSGDSDGRFSPAYDRARASVMAMPGPRTEPDAQ